MTNYVAFLRGINVGGKNLLPMKELAIVFEEAGCASVRTYIQSGNVLFGAKSADEAGLTDKLSRLIKGRFGFSVPVVLRTAEELVGVIAGNPFLKAGVPEENLHVYFLANVPAAADVARLDPARSEGDEFAVHHREIYLRMPNGMGRTKLTNAYFDSKLHTTSTARNWRTILRLSALIAQERGLGGPKP